MRSSLAFGVAALAMGVGVAAFADGPIPGSIPKGPFTIEAIPLASGLVAPNFMATVQGDNTRKFIVDQPGQIREIKNGVLLSTPFLDISATAANVADRRVVPLAPAYDERGLLGMAFDPDFNNSAKAGFHRVFTFTSEPVGATPTDYTGIGSAPTYQSVLASWKVSTANPDQIDTSTRQELFRYDHPVATNHNGGDIAFGPDGFLYIASGDGGQANDTGDGHILNTGNAQDNGTPLGKIMRIDVNGTNGKHSTYGIPAGNPFAADATNTKVKEIYATGFRNPFRFSFANGSLYVADVGQNTVEEVDKVDVGKNYGWHYKEGTFYFNPNNPNVVSATPIVGVTPGTAGAPVATMPDVTDPILQYDHDDSGVIKRISIIGGYVYHGTRLVGMQGKYIFGDFSSSFGKPDGSLYYADLTTGEIRQFILGDNDHPLNFFVKGIGEDADGELYVMATSNLGPSGTTGFVLSIVPEPTGLAAVGLVMVALGRRRRACGCARV